MMMNAPVGYNFEVTPQAWNAYFSTPYPVNTDTLVSAPSAYAPAVTPAAQVTGIISFAEWLKATYPEIYNSTLQTMPEIFIPEFALSGMRLNGLGNTSAPETDWGTRIMSMIEKLLPAAAQYQGQRDLIKANIKLAERGMPLLSGQDIAPQLNVGVSSEAERLVKYAIFGAIGIGLLYVLLKARK
jgi:hypothetical protein